MAVFDWGRDMAQASTALARYGAASLSPNVISGTPGRDSISAAEPDPDGPLVVVQAGGGNDAIFSDGAHVLLGEDGDDYIVAYGAGLRLEGGAGHDEICVYDDPSAGGEGSIWQVIDGGSGNDYLRIDAPAMTLLGGEGDDFINMEALAEYVDGGVGNDTLGFGYDNKWPIGVTVDLGAPGGSQLEIGWPVVVGFENVVGTDHADRLFGDGAANGLNGQDGDDLLRGGGGADHLWGGDGSDTADFRDKTAAVVLSLNGNRESVASVGGAAEDRISRVENVYGGAAGDTFRGDAGDNRLMGFGGNDVLRGMGGADTLSGGVGRDAFCYNLVSESTVALSGRDRITDFDGRNGDKIVVRGIDADTTRAGDQAFTFGGLKAGEAGRLEVTGASPGYFLVEADVNGDGVADFAIDVAGVILGEANFVL